MSNIKTPHKAPKIEDIKLNDDMAFTYNPNAEADPTRPLMQFINNQYKKLNELAGIGGFKAEIYPESSPLGRIHFHGFIQIVDIHKWIHIGVIGLKDTGCFAIKQFFERKDKEDEDDDHLTGKEKWTEYCLKQKNIIKPLFANNVLEYPLQVGYKEEDEDKPQILTLAKNKRIKKEVQPRLQFI